MQEPSESKKEGENKTREQKVEEIMKILIEVDKDKSVAEATQEAELKVDWEADFNIGNRLKALLQQTTKSSTTTISPK